MLRFYVLVYTFIGINFNDQMRHRPMLEHTYILYTGVYIREKGQSPSPESVFKVLILCSANCINWHYPGQIVLF